MKSRLRWSDGPRLGNERQRHDRTLQQGRCLLGDGITPTVCRLRQLPLSRETGDNYPVRSKVIFHDPVIRIDGGGNCATSSGTYEFNVETKGGRAVNQVLWFSFAYVKNGDQWLIVQQHSS